MRQTVSHIKKATSFNLIQQGCTSSKVIGSNFEERRLSQSTPKIHPSITQLFSSYQINPSSRNTNIMSSVKPCRSAGKLSAPSPLITVTETTPDHHHHQSEDTPRRYWTRHGEEVVVNYSRRLTVLGDTGGGLHGDLTRG